MTSIGDWNRRDQSWVYDEMRLVAEAIRSQLRSFSIAYGSLTYLETLQNLRVLGAPPFDIAQVNQVSTPALRLSRGSWVLLHITCFYHLHYFILFEDQDPCETIGYGEVEAAFTV